MKNILVVDDSALMRRVLSDIINHDDKIHTDTSAVNGLEALELLRSEKKFDAIVLDIVMPVMDGLQFLEEWNKEKRKEKVLIVSTIAHEGAKETIRALELGAFDFVTKPIHLAEAKGEIFAQRLKQRLYMMLDIEWEAPGGSFSAMEKSLQKDTAKRRNLNKMNALKEAFGKEQASGVIRHSGAVTAKGSKKLVALACSTGGPKALQSVIPYLPANLDAPILLVQHMPVGFTASLSSRLDELSAIRVKEAQDGEILQGGTVYIAKGGSQMRLVEKNRQYYLSVREEEARNGLKPCADIMYESLRGLPFDDITCVILTGMGADGTKGILELEKTNNIYVIAQDAESSTVYGMPKAIAQTGAVDEVHSLKDIANAITKHVGVL